MNVVIRKATSGPPVNLSDTLSPPGTILGRPLDAIGEGFAQPLMATQVGAIQRFSGYHAVTLAAGTHNNVPIPDGVRLVDITANGAVTITGFQVSGRGNDGTYIILRKVGNSAQGTISIPSNASPITNNRLFCAGATTYLLQNDGDCMVMPRMNTNRWQTGDRLLIASAIAPTDAAALGLPFYIRATFTAGGAPADDITVSLAIAKPIIIYDVLLQVGTAAAASTATLRTAAGGLGTAVSSALDTATTGTRRNADSSTPALPAASNLFLRRSTGAIAGTLLVFCKPTP